jgi:acyl-CoA thioesterase-1
MNRTLDKLARGEHATIVALGDSNTQLTFHTQGRQNWVGLLGEALFERYGAGAFTLVNSGRCASTVRDALGRLDRDVLRFQPDLVIVALGMNDATRREAGLDAFAADARELIRRIREAGGSEVLVCTPNPVVTLNGLPLPPEQPAAGRAWESPSRPVRAYAERLAAVGREAGCLVCDHYAAWTARAFAARHPVADPNGLWPRMSDAIHPGPLGHLAFFRELAPLFDLPAYFPWEDVAP